MKTPRVLLGALSAVWVVAVAQGGEPAEAAPAATVDALAPVATLPPPSRLATRVLSQPPSFAYAQCANVCQTRQDRVVTLCFTPDNPNKPAGPRPANCDDFGMAEYLACLDTCPPAATAESAQ